jgi:uncharacterized protein (DUF305 family)
MNPRLVLAAVLSLALLLGACSGDDGHDMGSGRPMGDMPMDDLPMDDMHRSGRTSSTPDDAEFNAEDVGFAQGMIVHHGQAVTMADLAIETSANPEVISLAERIVAAQDPEIDLMSGWLSEWGQAVPDPNMGHRGGAMAEGMMTEADMAEMERASGTDFDRLFLEMMVVHHEGAIAMAEELLADGRYPAAQELAEEVISVQRDEVEAMRALLERLPA